MPQLNDKLGSSTAKQRQLLHKIKRRLGFSDEQLHDAIGAASTKDLSAAAASAAIDRLGGFALPNEPGTKKSPYAGKKPSAATRMITDDHVDEILRLGLAYFPDHYALMAWLAKNFKIPFATDARAYIRQLGTAKRAGEVIRVLKEMNRRVGTAHQDPG